jgi:hypothetical protein
MMEQPNLSYIQGVSCGDKTFEHKLIGIIKNEFPIEKQVYIANITCLNYKLSADIVHKLKHKISILGLVKSYEIAICYEHNLLEKSIEGREDFESILQRITEFLETI